MDCQKFDHELDVSVDVGGMTNDALSHANTCRRCARRRKLVLALTGIPRAEIPQAGPHADLDERILAASRRVPTPWSALLLRVAAGFLLLIGGTVAAVTSVHGGPDYDPLILKVVEEEGSATSGEALALEQLFNEVGPVLVAGGGDEDR